MSQLRESLQQEKQEDESISITDHLHRWNSGDSESAARAISLIYNELRAIAATYLHKERPGHTLQPTALVHEVYLELFGESGIEWRNRAHFLGVAARVMRRLLIDYAREHGAVKRGGRMKRLSFDGLEDLPAYRAPQWIALDDAIRDLEALDPRQARLVEARFFGGMNVEETADYLGVSRATVIREWRRTKAWLHAELCSELPHAG